jgi:transcriptional regulator with XRE-family HTH domain
VRAEDYQAQRIRAGLTPAEVARRTGFHRSTVVRIESGERNAGPEYQAAFLNAVREDYSDDDSRFALVIAPALKARKVIADNALRLSTQGSDLDKLRHVLTQAMRAVSNIAEQAEVLSSGALVLDTCDFYPNLATDDELKQVTDYICDVLLEMFMDHKFHLLTDAEIDAYLNSWAQNVAREAKKTRNRLRLARREENT